MRHVWCEHTTENIWEGQVTAGHCPLWREVKVTRESRRFEEAPESKKIPPSLSLSLHLQTANTAYLKCTKHSQACHIESQKKWDLLVQWEVEDKKNKLHLFAALTTIISQDFKTEKFKNQHTGYQIFKKSKCAYWCHAATTLLLSNKLQYSCSYTEQHWWQHVWQWAQGGDVMCWSWPAPSRFRCHKCQDRYQNLTTHVQKKKKKKSG